jgi:hypothetical protein
MIVVLIKFLHAGLTKINNQNYPTVPPSSRDFSLHPWDAKFIDKENFEPLLLAQFDALTRFKLQLDFSPQCLLIQVAVIFALCKQSGLIIFPWGQSDSCVLGN